MLSVVIPTYNESANLPVLIPKIIAAVPSDHPLEIIVVDDNSPDGTWEVAQQLGKIYPNVRVNRRLHAKGLSSAVMEGFSMAMGDYLLVMDADLQHDETIIANFLVEFKNGAEIVIGSRNIEGGGVGDWSYLRRLMSWTATQMARIILPQLVSDPMSGFFAVRKDFFKEVADEVNPRGFKILLEFVYRVGNRKVAEVPYVFKNRLHGESKLSGGVVVDYIMGLYDLRFGKVLPVPFIKYSLVGLSGVVVNQLVLWLGINFLDLRDFIALALSIEVSLVSNYLLNNSWTFRQGKLSGKQFWRGLFLFHAVCLLGALLNYSVALTLSRWLGASIYLTNLIGIVLSTVWNYLLNLQFTWKKSG